MAAQKENPSRLFWILGLAITMPMILLSGPVAGYFISYILITHYGLPSFTSPLFMGLGLLGSGIQCYRLIQKMNQVK